MKHNIVKTIKHLINEYGTDWSKIENSKLEKIFSGVDFFNQDLREITLPKDRAIFQLIRNRCLSCTKLPECDYSIYEFSDMNITSVKFTKNSRLPSNSDFFQKIGGKSISYTELPDGDYSYYDFNGVRIKGTIFTEESKLKSTRTLFQDFFDRNISETKFPKGDYRMCLFKNIICRKSVFTKDSLLPEYTDFLKDISEDYQGIMRIGSNEFVLTENVVKNVHNYNLKDVHLDLTDYSEQLTNSQLSIIQTKYRDKIGNTILLPKKGLLKENSKVITASRELLI